jgi:hypothetical protein
VTVAPTTTDTAAVPAPVIPYGDPATGSTDATLSQSQQNSEALTAENQAQQITSASLQSYGSLPNPQVAFEAITTGATPTIASMIEAGNPLFQAELAGAPAGQNALTTPYPSVPSKIDDPAQSLWDAPSAQDQKNTLANSPGWKSFGTAPEMNFAWMQQQSQGSPASIKKWQNLLVKQGFYSTSYKASGVWDQSTEAAFQSFMIQWATPYALFSTDATTRGNANEFLSGLGIDAPTLETSIGRDPSTLAQIAQGWMAAQGPDASTDQKSELQSYSDQFGQAALPDSYQAILQTNLGQTVRDTMASLPFVESIPGVSGAYNIALNALTGNVGDLSHAAMDPRAARAQQIQTEMTQQDNLSQADVENLNPALQEVADDSGFLGFMSDYDNARTTTILTVFDMFKDFATGHTSKNMNPFDPLSTPRVEAAAANNNMAAGIFGQGWATDNPGWATFFNLATNMADDPTSYLPLIGELSVMEKGGILGDITRPSLSISRQGVKLGEKTTTIGFGGIRTVSRVIGNDAARLAFNDHISEVGRMGINQGYFNAARTAYKLPQSRGLADATRMFGLSGAGGANDVRKLRLVQQMMEEPDDQKAWDLFQNGNKEDPNVDDVGFGYLANSGKGLYNQRSAWSAMTSVKSTKALGKIRAVGGFNISTDWDALNDPIGTGQFFDNLAVVAGVKAEEIKPLIDAYMKAATTDPDNVMRAAKAVEDAIKENYLKNNGINEQAFTKWIGDATSKVVAYAPDPVTGTETSQVLRAQGADDTEKALAQAVLNKRQQEMKLLQSTGASADDIAQAQAKIDEIARPAPALTTQLGNEYTFPWSPFDMVVYKNPAFRNIVKLQRWSGIDKVMDAWRRLTIGRISSAMRMDIGDDMIRPFSALVGMGHPIAGFQYLTQSIAKMTGLLVPGARGKILESLDDFLEHNPEAARMLQTVGKTMQETSTNIWDTAQPTDVGYAEGLASDIRNHWSQDPISQAWLKAAPGEEKATLKKFLQESEDPKVQAWIKARNMTLNPDLFDYQVDSADDFMKTYFRNPTLRKMAATGKVSDKQLQKLIHDNGANPAGGLPIIKMRSRAPFAQNQIMQWASKGPEEVFSHFTGPMINTARSGGFMKIKGLYEQQMRKFFKDEPRYGTKQFEDSIERESTSRAIDWIQNNTYQGTRSVMGASLRNVFPFYGATANMDRFYMKQAMATPFVGSAVMHTLAAIQQSESVAEQNTNPGMIGLQGILAHLGFGAGEGLQIDPLHAFFLTGDGIGSMVPGTGPIFAPLWTLAAHTGNGGFAQILADVIPGAAEQIDYSTGQAQPQFPWLAQLLTGASMAATGQNYVPSIPGLTESEASTDSAVNSAIQEWERANNRALNPTDPDYDSIMTGINQQVGRDYLLQGAASFTLPVSPEVVNAQQLNTANNLDTWRAQTSDGGKDQVILQNLPGVTNAEWQAALAQTAGAPTVAQLVAKAGPNSDAALMAYDDSRVSESDRDAIANAEPWVVSASTSKYQTANLGPEETDRPFDLPQWQIMRNNGDITNLTPDQFVGQISNERDINTGWLEYDNLKDQEYQAMQQNGWTTASPQYTAWNAAYFQPQLQSIETNHPSWDKQFGSGGGTTAADLSNETRALRTLQTWEVLPQHSDYENSQTVLWRNALQLRDNAAGELYALKQGGGSTAEQELVMSAFQSQLAALAATNSAFADQLAGFRFNSWEDIVDLEADEMAANALAGYPAQLGTQGQG